MAIKKEYLKPLDGIRGFAIILVLLSHLSNAGAYFLTERLSFSGAGRYGVFLFFVLSSFILTKQFLDTNPNRSNFVSIFLEYLYRRVTRIYPLYFCALVAYFAPTIIIGKGLYIESVRQILESLLLFKGYGIFWTIPVEFTFYFILPWVAIFFIALRKRKALLYSVTLLAIFLTAYALPRTYEQGMLPFIFIFLIGSLLAQFYRDIRDSQVGKSPTPKIIPLFLDFSGILAFLAFFLFIPNFYNQLFSTDYHLTHFHERFLLFGVLSAALMFFTLKGRGLLSRLFSNRVLRFYGKISYSAYLWHMLMIETLKKVSTPNSTLNFVVFLALITAFSYLSYLIFERTIYKSSRLRRRWEMLAAQWV